MGLKGKEQTSYNAAVVENAREVRLLQSWAAMPIQSIQSRSAEEWLATLPANVPTLLYKYSPYCGVSSQADHEVDCFLERHPEVRFYAIDVVHERAISSALAQLLGIQHASPQLLVLERGQAVWNQSHYGITCEAIEAQLARSFAP